MSQKRARSAAAIDSFQPAAAKQVSATLELLQAATNNPKQLTNLLSLLVSKCCSAPNLEDFLQQHSPPTRSSQFQSASFLVRMGEVVLLNKRTQFCSTACAD